MFFFFFFRLLDVVNDNPDVFYRQAWKPLMSTAIQAAAEFLGADPNNMVLVQNATTGKQVGIPYLYLM